MNEVENFVTEFFNNLKCEIRREGDILIIEKVPKSFEDLYGKLSPYKISFSGPQKDVEFVGRGSPMVSAISRYLEGAGKTTLLKIDFDVDPRKEIERAISLKNCEISNLIKQHKNNFFSRFTFMTTFRYLNESEQILNEVYVHNGEIVKGDLSGYSVVEGDIKEAITSHIERDYQFAKERIRELLKDKTEELGKSVGEKLEKEIGRIKIHYQNLLSELGGNLNENLEKIKETELQLRVADEKEVEPLRARLNRLRGLLVKVGNDSSKEKILKEQEFTIRDARNKYSLNVDNKLINTTIIYYPVFSFNLFVRNENAGKVVKMDYNPLTKKVGEIFCDACDSKISRINLCSNGHVVCDFCLGNCSECGKPFCRKCLKRACFSCGKLLCKNCSEICSGCGNSSCKTHIRIDCVSGEKRCMSCLRACLRCHGMTEERYFGEARDGSKVCQKCLGEEKRSKVMKEIFED